MHIIDSHFHYWPLSVWTELTKRKEAPRARLSETRKGGYDYFSSSGRQEKFMGGSPEWFYLDEQLAHMDGLGHQVDVVCSIGPFSVVFSDMEKNAGKALATLWNEEMAAAQRRYPGAAEHEPQDQQADTGDHQGGGHVGRVSYAGRLELG
jgi:aminocarboxymuconate-semialdehyde decarboxylase